MRRRYFGLVLFCLVAWVALGSPSRSSAGSIMVIRGSTLIQDGMDGLITLPDGAVITYLEIQLASWGLNYTDEDILVFDPATKTLSHYAVSTMLNLPVLEKPVSLTNQRTGTITEILEEEPFVVLDTDIGRFEVMDRTPASVAAAPEDNTAPDTSITGGPSGVITNNDVTFTYTGSDNDTSVSGLAYATRLDGIDSDWSAFVPATTRSYTNLPNGNYTFSVKARDRAGNVDRTPATRSFSVDVAIPAFEVVITPESVSVPEGGTGGFRVTLNARPASDVTVSVTWLTGDPDIRVTSEAKLVFTSADWNIAQKVTLAADEDEDAVNGKATLLISGVDITDVKIAAAELDNDTGTGGEVSLGDAILALQVLAGMTPAEGTSARI